MPKILSYTPAWLARPSPGYHLFAPKHSTSRTPDTKDPSTGLRKTIATRDSEIFVAVGHELRWADLALLKEDESPIYRTLKVSVPLPIQRLTISPSGEFLAVSTSHTVHVVCLPAYDILLNGNDGPIKPATYQVGPTAHVLEESPVASVLWHPLGYHGHCLVTITQAGVVRLWELNRSNRSTFSEPSLSIALEKLANAQTDAEDVGASKLGASKGFSPDSVDLEVASACFGDFPDQEGVHGWAPMTLWIATISGAVYALCPLLPAKWQLVEAPGAATFMHTLSSSINIRCADVNEDDEAPKEAQIMAEKQHSWMNDILYQEPVEETHKGDVIKMFTRPSSVPAVPLLQGPFSIVPDVDDFELSDMIVYTFKTFSAEEDEEEEETAIEGLPAAVVCLLTDTCQVHVCLDLEGITGRWLPSPKDNIEPSPIEHSLIVAETITLTNNSISSFQQSITPDIHTDFSFFVTHEKGVFYISLEPWVRKLEFELSSAQTEGSTFRLTRILESATSTVEQCMRRHPGDTRKEVTASVVIEDGNVGYLLLTTLDDEPQAVLLDAPESNEPTDEEIAEYMDVPSLTVVAREPWHPPKAFWQPYDLRANINIEQRHKNSLKEEIVLSHANLEIMMSAHRALAAHTDRLQHAVSDLFNRCQRLQDEYREQLVRVAQQLPKIEAVTGSAGEEGAEYSGDASGTPAIETRLAKAKAKQEALNTRFQALRKKMGNIGESELSEKEARLLQELQALDGSLDRSAQTLSDDVDGSEVPAWQRLDKIKEMKRRLAKEVEGVAKAGGADARAEAAVKVPVQSRKQENEEVQRMLRHLQDVTEATMNHLSRLKITALDEDSL